MRIKMIKIKKTQSKMLVPDLKQQNQSKVKLKLTPELDQLHQLNKKKRSTNTLIKIQKELNRRDLVEIKDANNS